MPNTDYMIFTDSSADLSAEVAQKNNVTIIPYYVCPNPENEKYYREGIEITRQQIYDSLVSGKMPKTSLPPIDDYRNAFKTALDKGKDVLCICLSQKLSGSFQSAFNAGELLKEEYPNSKIVVIDSKQATVGQALVVLEAVQMRNDGIDIETNSQNLLKLLPQSTIMFTVDSLEHLQKGGRIGKASALLGTLLNIKPILTVIDGEVAPVTKVRGRKKALDTISRCLLDFMDNPQHYNTVLGSFEGNGNDCIDMANALEKATGIVTNNEPIFLGATIGSHTGPTAMGVAAIKSYKYL